MKPRYRFQDRNRSGCWLPSWVLNMDDHYWSEEIGYPHSVHHHSDHWAFCYHHPIDPSHVKKL